jgi:peptide/nickel transport system permease protein
MYAPDMVILKSRRSNSDDSLSGARKSSMLQERPSQIAWRRLKRNRVAMAGGMVSAFFVVLAFGAPIFTNLFHVNNSATYPNVLAEDGIPLHGLNGISIHHPFGVEPGTGRDLFALMLYGSRISFTVAVLAGFSFIAVGLILGTTAAYLGGWVDNALGRLTDFLLSFPTTFLLIALSTPLVLSLEHWGIAQGNGARVVMLVGVLSFFSWPGFFRVIRSQVLSIREKEFVLAALALGASKPRIIFREILPNVWSTAIIYLTISLPAFLSSEAALSFLGVGVQAPGTTWGLTLSDATNYWQRDPTYLAIPAGMIVIVVVSLNLFGDGLRDALDSKSDR